MLSLTLPNIFSLLDKEFMLPFGIIRSLRYHITTMKLSQVLHVKNMISQLGYYGVVEYGLLFDIYLWKTEWMNEVLIKYCVTEWILAVILKNPLQRELFIRLRSVILGYKPIFKLNLKWIKMKENFEIYDQNSLVNNDLWYKMTSK